MMKDNIIIFNLELTELRRHALTILILYLIIILMMIMKVIAAMNTLT